MAPRLELHAILTELLGTDQVYFSPPPSVYMKYPCIVYRRDWIQSNYADDITYKLYTRYQVTSIDRNPDSDVVEKIALLPMCTYDRFFIADNLNHDVFKLFF